MTVHLYRLRVILVTVAVPLLILILSCRDAAAKTKSDHGTLGSSFTTALSSRNCDVVVFYSRSEKDEDLARVLLHATIRTERELALSGLMLIALGVGVECGQNDVVLGTKAQACFGAPIQLPLPILPAGLILQD
ncbi:MAG: hypothetical protein KAY24_02640 [Candidatus Eisenbacteria sp.]|nr:hypothetical protein [Candidatus Eisenbacteria bacterium]